MPFTPTLATPVPSVTKRKQLVVKTTPGTTPSSPTWKRLPTLAIMPGPKFETQKFRGQGYKLPSAILKGKEWVTLKYDGAATVAELCYVLSSYGTTATITTVGTTAKQWVFTPQTSNPDTIVTYSMQHGDSGGGWSLTYGQFTSMTLNITRDAIKVSGEGIGQYWTTGASLGSSPTTIENVPLLGSEVNVSLDASYGSLGTTQLKSPYELEISLPNKFNPTFPLNTAAPGHAGTVEVPTEPQVKLKLGADSQSDGLVTDIRNASVLYLQVNATTPVVADSAGPTYYSFQWQMALQVAEGGDMEDMGGVYVGNWTHGGVVDTTDNIIWVATLVNKTASL